jgi:phosphotransferase system enzyme I (PtsI)
MVTDPRQFVELKRAFVDMTRDISGVTIQHGLMIEVPAACLQAREILAIADFASVGTNDLLQYLYAVDRDNELVAGNDSLSSTVLWSLLEQVTHAARDFGRPLSVCGEVAADGRYAKNLITAGVTSVSVASRLISGVRAEARKQLRLQEHGSRRSSRSAMEGGARS